MQNGDISASLMLWRQVEGLMLRDESDNPMAIRRFLTRNPGLSFVIEDADGELIGSILCGHDGRRGFIYHLAVSPDHRRSSYATTLIGTSLKGLARLGITRCHAFVRIDDAGADGFWRPLQAKFQRDISVFTMTAPPSRDKPVAPSPACE
jgi:ribosomal protein S18 acetylase RimI-like enzyme